MSPNVMKALMFYGAHDMRVEDVPVPVPEAGQVKVKVAWCGICGTDLHEYEAGPIFCPSDVKPHGVTGEKLPVCMGHEFSGTIVEVGTGLQGSWKVGDRVVVEPVISCHKCYACSSKLDHLCDNVGFVGLSGWGGGLSEFVAVREEMLHRLPDHVSFQFGAMVEPLAVAMHAVELSEMKKGATALVVGAGPIGCFVVKSLLARGAGKVIVSEPSETRRKMALRAGAHHVLSPKEVDVVDAVRRLTAVGGNDVGVDVSFECAGLQASINVTIAALRPRGTCINVAIWSIHPKIDVNALVLGEKTLRGSLCYKNNHGPALAALASGEIDLEGFVTATVKLQDVVKSGFEELIHNTEAHVKILVSLTGTE